MSRPLYDSWLVTLHDPRGLPISNLLLELVVIACAVATFAHAWRARRAGDPLPLFTWLTILVYGIAMEVLSYNLFDNFTHAQFSVMFYEQQLPLYVTAIYPAFLYTAIATVRRAGLPTWLSPLAAGLVIVAMDFPFDILGPRAGWWSWSATDPNLGARWHGVPVTSYYWHLAFGGILAAVTSWLGRRRAGRPASWQALPAALLTIVLGMLAFAPFHGLKAAGVPDGVFVGSALAAALVLTAWGLLRRGRSDGPDLLLLSIPTLFYGYHLALALVIGSGPPLVVIALVTIGAALLHATVHRSGAEQAIQDG